MSDTLPQLIARASLRSPERPAIQTPAGTHSYAELDRGISRVSTALRKHGVHGSRIGLLLPNLQSFPLAFYGILRGGKRAPAESAVLAPGNRRGPMSTRRWWSTPRW